MCSFFYLNQGLKNRIGLAGPTGWTCNGTQIRADLAKQPSAPLAHLWIGRNRSNRWWPAKTGKNPGCPVYESQFLITPCSHRCAEDDEDDLPKMIQIQVCYFEVRTESEKPMKIENEMEKADLVDGCF